MSDCPFKELTDEDIRKRLFESQQQAIEHDMTPFGFMDDGMREEETEFKDADGDLWQPVRNYPDFFDISRN